ncbi:MAG TPA: hypothetical protein VI319_08300 [Burkholderiales bacterium]
MRTISWKLPIVLSASFVFAADGHAASGYKGIPWGAACSEAVRNLQAQSFVFDRTDKLGLPPQARSPQEPQLFARSSGLASCSSEESDLRLDTHRANPYVEIAAASGDITVTLLCRDQRFVGARLETPMGRTAAVAMLTKAAGASVRTIRANTCGEEALNCTADHSLLLSRGDTVRYLEKPVRSSRGYAGQDPPLIRYLILARSEDRALQTASLACAKKRLADGRLEKQRIQDGNRAALQ